ncbi:molybdate ABC transporter substrate-binding protein [Pseudoalteromonas denitrificans]|uniref:Molybdate transport system substrate-binding protein n=1 Tax=Pseudoalteromonas denitrificans DSM 6059 TaxID=1123010 RepID=A0A1I1GZG9_9GAMM|nr:molybdate ABC transporter substrate-binding protein [Pseudoalteromonas denitrificans]SFC16682.1 molybdate transport system substrate-binding protein [Pseudoalteromonas denitrificans DSM 6059]
MRINFLLISIFLLCFKTFATPLRVAVASNFKLPLSEIINQYQENTGNEVSISSASSGILYQQIKAGAPYDVFLSADELRPDLLIKNDLAYENSKVIYAVGILAFYSPNKKVILNELKQSDNDKIKISIANPLHAPYGLAAKNILQELFQNIEVFKGTFITSNNIASTFQIVHSGNAPAGFVALSHIISTKVPRQDYQILSSDKAKVPQAAVILKRSKDKAAAKKFLTYLSSPEAIHQIIGYGYEVVKPITVEKI